MIIRKLFVFLLLSVLSLPMIFSKSAHAESYFGASIGVALSSEAESIDIVTGATTASITDLDASSSFAYGFKAGHYFKSIPWFGVEFNVFQSDPDVDKQTTTLSGTANGIYAAGAGQTRIDVNHMTTYGFLAMFRATEEQTKNMFNIEPYLGLGVAINNISLGRGTAYDAAGAVLAGGVENLGSDTSAGFLLSAGLNYKINNHLKAYGEYKYTDVSFEDTTNGTKYDFDLDASSLMFGVSYHF